MPKVGLASQTVSVATCFPQFVLETLGKLAGRVADIAGFGRVLCRHKSKPEWPKKTMLSLDR